MATREERERKIVDAAMVLLEKRLRDNTATSETAVALLRKN